jgi:coenzyme F420-reducing hydrogenase delta subunit
MQNFSDEKIAAQIKDAAASWTTGKGAQALAFVCIRSHGNGFKWPPNIHEVPVRCSGRVDPLHILHAFTLGADGVLIISCEDKDCHYIFGSTVAEKRVEQTKEWLEAVGINPDRLQFSRTSVGKEKNLVEILEEFTVKLNNAGKTPIKYI